LGWSLRRQSGRASVFRIGQVDDMNCSFCNKGQEEVRKLIAGPKVYICDECIELCNDIIAEEWDDETSRSSKLLQTLVDDFARGLRAADARLPQAVDQRSGKRFMPGIGPHTEAQTLELVLREMGDLEPSRYAHVETVAVTPNAVCSRDDIVVHLDDTHWLVEVRRLRILDDDGTQDDRVVRNILSPFPQHHSALTDCEELKNARFEGQKAVLLYGYEDDDWPLESALSAFETLARKSMGLGPRRSAYFDGLCHPFLRAGGVHAWEVL